MKNLYLSCAVQKYLFGTPMRVLATHKKIYKHGNLRKLNSVNVTIGHWN